MELNAIQLEETKGLSSFFQTHWLISVAVRETLSLKYLDHEFQGLLTLLAS